MNVMINNNIDGTRRGYRTEDEEYITALENSALDQRRENEYLETLNKLTYDNGYDKGYEDVCDNHNDLLTMVIGLGVATAVTTGIIVSQNYKRRKLKKQWLSDHKDMIFEVSSLNDMGYPETLHLTPEEYWIILDSRLKRMGFK